MWLNLDEAEDRVSKNMNFVIRHCQMMLLLMVFDPYAFNFYCFFTLKNSKINIFFSKERKFEKKKLAVWSIHA